MGFLLGQVIPSPDWLNLPEGFDQVTWGGIARWQWLALAGLLLLSIVAGHVSRWLIAVVFRWRYKLWDRKISERASRGVKRALVWLSAAGVYWLLLPEIGLEGDFHRRLYIGLQIVTIAAFVWLAYSLWDAACDLIAERAHGFGRRTEKLLIPITQKLVRVLIIIAGALIVFGVMGVNVSGILAGVGIGGLVVALAAKDSVENIFGSFTILFDMPFALGDWVKIGPIEGAVEEINLRSTRIRTAEDSIITLPNSNLIKASVENLGARRFRRLKFTFGVAYDTPSARLETFLQGIRDLLGRNPLVRREGYYAELNEMTDVSLRVLVDCGLETLTVAEELRLKAELLLDINDMARRLGIQLQGAPKPEDPQPLPGVAGPAQLGDTSPVLD